MNEKTFLVVSIVRDLTDNTLLVIRKKEEMYRKPTDAFPADIKPIGENAVQTAVRITFEQTGVTIKNPKEIAEVKVEMLDEEKNYVILVFVSTEFSGSLHPASNTDVVWQGAEDSSMENTEGAYIIRHVLAGKHVTGTYSYTKGEFSVKEIRDM